MGREPPLRPAVGKFGCNDVGECSHLAWHESAARIDGEGRPGQRHEPFEDRHELARGDLGIDDERGLEDDALTRDGERAQQIAVVRLHRPAHALDDTLAAALERPLVGRIVVGVDQALMIGEAGRGLRRAAAFEIGGRGAGDDRHGGDAARDRGRAQRRRDPDAEIEAIADEIGRRIVQPYLQVDSRMLRAEAADRGIEPPGGEGVGQGHAKPDRSRRPVQPRRFRLDPVEIVDELPVEGEELFARVGEAEAAGRAIQQAHADRLFEFPNHARCARLRKTGLFRRPDERSRPHDLQENFDRSELVHSARLLLVRSRLCRATAYTRPKRHDYQSDVLCLLSHGPTSEIIGEVSNTRFLRSGNNIRHCIWSSAGRSSARGQQEARQQRHARAIRNKRCD